MDRVHRLLGLAILVALAAGCGTPPATPSPLLAPTLRPTPTPVAGDETLGPAGVLHLDARDVAFTPQVLATRAGAPFVIEFRNLEDATMPHNVDLRRLDGQTVVQEQEPIMGGQTAEYAYDALPAGDYIFICRVHPIPAMTGTLRVR